MSRPEIEPVTWRAFRSLVQEGKGAGEPSITLNVVGIATSRVLDRLRQKIDRLLN